MAELWLSSASGVLDGITSFRPRCVTVRTGHCQPGSSSACAVPEFSRLDHSCPVWLPRGWPSVSWRPSGDRTDILWPKAFKPPWQITLQGCPVVQVPSKQRRRTFQGPGGHLPGAEGKGRTSLWLRLFLPYPILSSKFDVGYF